MADSKQKDNSSENTSVPKSKEKSQKLKKVKPVGADGHRERLRSRYLESDPESIEDYHLLELLLFYSIPRRDTRDEAMALMSRFGSIKDIFMSDYEELTSVDGIGKNSAILISLVHEIMRRIDLDCIDKNMKYEDIDALGNLFSTIMRGEKGEIMYVLALDSAKRIIKLKKMYRSRGSTLNVFMRDITEFALSYRAAYIVISHNHPSGTVLPSYRDIEFTEALLKCLTMMNIGLYEHIICTDTAYYPIVKNKF